MCIVLAGWTAAHIMRSTACTLHRLSDALNTHLGCAALPACLCAGLVYEVWAALQQLPYTDRFCLYADLKVCGARQGHSCMLSATQAFPDWCVARGCWLCPVHQQHSHAPLPPPPAASTCLKQEGGRTSLLLTAAAKLAETEVRRILRRVTAPANKKEAKTTMKPLGRMLAKIMHAAPLPVAEQLIRQVRVCAKRGGGGMAVQVAAGGSRWLQTAVVSHLPSPNP